jgi:hypothetical protein
VLASAHCLDDLKICGKLFQIQGVAKQWNTHENMTKPDGHELLLYFPTLQQEVKLDALHFV